VQKNLIHAIQSSLILINGDNTQYKLNINNIINHCIYSCFVISLSGFNFFKTWFHLYRSVIRLHGQISWARKERYLFQSCIWKLFGCSNRFLKNRILSLLNPTVVIQWRRNNKLGNQSYFHCTSQFIVNYCYALHIYICLPHTKYNLTCITENKMEMVRRELKNNIWHCCGISKHNTASCSKSRPVLHYEILLPADSLVHLDMAGGGGSTSSVPLRLNFLKYLTSSV
jgi:hypothetical protein